MRAAFLRVAVSLTVVGAVVTGGAAVSGGLGPPACVGADCMLPAAVTPTGHSRDASSGAPVTARLGAGARVLSADGAAGRSTGARPAQDASADDTASGATDSDAGTGTPAEDPQSPTAPTAGQSTSVAAGAGGPTGAAASPSTPSAAASTPTGATSTGTGPVSTPAGFPDLASTGHRTPLAQLTASGSVKVTQDDTVLEGLHVRGAVIVEANDVVIRDSFIEYAGDLYPLQQRSGYRGLVVEGTTIDAGGEARVAVMNQAYRLTRVQIRNAIDGPRIEGDDVTIEDSLIHLLSRRSGTHNDTIQIRRGHNIRIVGNSLLAHNTATADPMNAAIQIGSLLGSEPISGLVIEGNYMTGGNYTLNAGKGAVREAAARDNVFAPDARYGPVAHRGSGWVWANNRFVDGTPVG